MAFPSSPTNGQTYTTGGVTYVFNSTKGVWQIETYDTVDAAGALTSIKTVDGSSSGLDADLLDGLTSSQFLRSDTNDTATGHITFLNGTDRQITLQGVDTWAGIEWRDVNGYDYTWYNGSTSTFAIGGNGSAISGKKLHINGGTSIGSGLAGTAAPTNGLIVEGRVGIQATSISYPLTVNGGTEALGVTLSGTPRLSFGSDGTWNYFKAHSGNGHLFSNSNYGTVFNIDGSSNPITHVSNGDLRLRGGQSRLAFYRFGQGNSTPYHHVKTTIPWAGHTQMYSIEFEGHEYGASRPISARKVWYSYSPSGSPISQGGDGTHTITLYQSADGYVVIRLDMSSGYYAAWTLNQYTTNQGLNPITVTSVSGSTSATAY